MSFFTELKRRNVVKIGAAYAIVAWLLIQVASIIVPAYQAPGWVMPIFITLISIGFPIAIFLAWVYELTPEGIQVTPAASPDPYHTQATGNRLNYFIVGVLVLVVVFVLIDRYVLLDQPGTTTASSVAGPVSTAAKVERDTITEQPTPVPASSNPVPSRRTSLVLGSYPSIAILGVKTVIALSADGNHLVYAVNENSNARLYHRDMNQLEARALPETGISPSFSPAGEWVAYETGSGLYKVSILGGAPQQLSDDVDEQSGCFWSEDDVIYFILNSKLHSVPASGGKAEPVRINGEYADRGHVWPYGLPGATHLLLTVTQNPLINDQGHTVLLSLETGDTQILIQNAYNARYVPTGHIVFMRTGSLWAVPFDIGRMQTTGPEVPVVNGVETSTVFGTSGYTFSNDGLLVYLPGEEITAVGGGGGDLNLVWVERDGQETPLEDIKLNTANAAPRLSPDGRQVAVGMLGQGGADIWTYDFERETFSRRTFDGNAVYAMWTPDGQRLLYGKFNEFGLHWTKADGTGQPERLIESTSLYSPDTMTPDGSQLVFRSVNTATSIDLFVMSVDGEHTSQPLIVTEFIESQPAISPDGHWIAYASTETGESQIYVRPFPDVDNGKWQISASEAQEPRWRGDGRELYFMSGGYHQVMAVPIDTDQGFQAGKPKVLISGNYVRALGRSYDVTADGQRFLMLKQSGAAGDDIESQMTMLVVVDNWFEELKRLAPPAK